MDFSARAISRLLRQIPVIWGRLADREGWWGTDAPQENPDTTDETLGERYHDARRNFAIRAACDARDFSLLFKSAGGIDDPHSDAFTDAQLIFDKPDLGDAEQLAALAYNYDHLFDPCFNLIIRKLSYSAWDYGRFIGEIDWQRLPDDDQNYPNLIYAVNILDRDPAEYLIHPGGFAPGLYRKNSAYATATSGDITKMDDARFLWWAWDSQFENPYGESMNRSLIMWVETWLQVYDYWRKGIEKAGLGAWTAAYPDMWDNNSSEATSKRERLMEMVKTIAKGSASIYNEKVTLENKKLDIEAQLFLDFHTEFKKAVSLRYLGTETALTEGEYGTYAGKESGEVRSRSDLQKFDALWFGAAMRKFNRLFCHLNFAKVPLVPRLQLVPVELITPVTPKDQMVEGHEEPEEPTPEEPKEFQAAEDEPKEPGVPVAIPAGFHDFPAAEKNPDIFAEVRERAQAVLADMPAIAYQKLDSGEGKGVFTIKRFRSFEQGQAILEALRDAIIPTMNAPTEQAAWKSYYDEAVSILAQHNLAMSPDLQHDLITSFRQTRQTAFNQAIKEMPGVSGFRIKAILDDRTRPISRLWADKALPKHDPRWDVLTPPSDFGDRGWLEPVYNLYDLTPESEIPTEFPGETYKYYTRAGGGEEA